MLAVPLIKLYWVTQVSNVNPRPTGGGGYFEPPLWFSCEIF